jgi:peroxiredoxin
LHVIKLYIFNLVMKKFLLGMLALSPLMAAAQYNNFAIQGKAGKLDAPAKVYLVYQLGANNVVDSSDVTVGNFLFNGKILNPVGASLFLDKSGKGFANFIQTYFPNGVPIKPADMLSLYLDKGDIKINAEDSIAKAEITGSTINDDNKKLTAQLTNVNNKAKKIIADAKAAPVEQQKTIAFQNSVQTKLKGIQTEQEEILKNFIGANPKSYLSLMALSSLGGPSADPKVIEPLYNQLSQELKSSEGGQLLNRSLTEMKVTAIGAMAPDFTQNDANDVPIKLSSFRGKYVLIDFWASWCGPCRQENPNVVRVFNKYKTKKFTILGVSLDRAEGKNDWMAAVKNDGLTWTQVSDLKYWNNAAAALYFVRSIPQNYLIDPEGKIIAKNLRGEDLENKLAEIFGKI